MEEDSYSDASHLVPMTDSVHVCHLTPNFRVSMPPKTCMFFGLMGKIHVRLGSQTQIPVPPSRKRALTTLFLASVVISYMFLVVYYSRCSLAGAIM